MIEFNENTTIDDIIEECKSRVDTEISIWLNSRLHFDSMLDVYSFFSKHEPLFSNIGIKFECNAIRPDVRIMHLAFKNFSYNEIGSLYGYYGTGGDDGVSNNCSFFTELDHLHHLFDIVIEHQIKSYSNENRSSETIDS
jgi:hypothetical protein